MRVRPFHRPRSIRSAARSADLLRLGRQAEEDLPIIQAKAREAVEHPLHGVRMDRIILDNQAGTVIVDTGAVIPSCSRSQDKLDLLHNRHVTLSSMLSIAAMRKKRRPRRRRRFL